MKAAVIVTGENGPRLDIQDVADPVPAPHEVLLRTRAIGLNRADLALRAGHFRAVAGVPRPPIAGLEVAGVVVAAGTSVSRFAIGDRVMAMAPGAYAELVAVDERVAIPVPASMEFEQAATAPVALMTAHDAVVVNGGLVRSEAVMITGATSAVGLMAINVAKLMGAGVVIGTTRSPDKALSLKKFGCDVAIDTGREDLAMQARQATGERGVDVVIDHVGGPVFPASMQAAAVGGRIVSVGRMAGLKSEIDLDLLSLKRLKLIGVTFRTRSPDEIAALIERMQADLWPAVTQGKLDLPIDRIFPLAHAAEAQAYMGSNGHLGKVVLTP